MFVDNIFNSVGEYWGQQGVKKVLFIKVKGSNYYKPLHFEPKVLSSKNFFCPVLYFDRIFFPSSEITIIMRYLLIIINNVCMKMFIGLHFYWSVQVCWYSSFTESSYTVGSEPRLLNLILLNLIVRWPSECSHYINNLWNATFGLWKIRIMNGWMVSFEWKTSKHQENRKLVATLWFNFESFRR